MAKYKRSEIRDAAQEYAHRYPSWTNAEINTMLRLEYDGAYLVNKTYDRLREATAAAVPYFHSIIPTGNEVKIMKAEGFGTSEVSCFLKSWQKTIDSPAFTAMRHSRIKWWVGLLRAGWTRKQVWAALNRWYDTTHQSPFAWLRKEYRPVRHIGMMEYRAAAQRRIEAKKREKAIKVTKPLYHLLRYNPKARARAYRR